ncbi:MAG TPA: hypothetical protein VN826_11700 [Candidatus Eisenbacteria bacterium]|nr:hypothetical protein [Candidatus Eisenbacteria bacterium]
MKKRSVTLVHNDRRQRTKNRTLLIMGLATYCSLFTKVSAAQEDQPLPTGTYRLEMIMASTTKIPFFGTSKSASKSISLVEIRHDGNGLIQNHQVCDFRVLEDSKLIKMIFPEKFIAALASHTYPIQIEKQSQGWRYRADLGVERIGYRSTSTEDKLPSKIDDPAVFDWDNDGHPGATLQLSIPLLPSGELYIVQRGQSILTGEIVEAGKVEGKIQVQSFEQRVLGARPSFLAKSPEIEPNPNESRFRLTPISPAATCAALREKT